MMMKYWLILFLMLIIFVTACSTSIDLSKDPRIQTKSSAQQQVKKINWQDFELKDLITGKTFKISKFDKPVLLDSFAVWCPTSIIQQREIKKLREEREDFISVSLDTDPNENERKVLNHMERQGFDWIYAMAPADLTRSLIAEFGVDVVNAPQAPMILICNGEARMLEKGKKSVDDLKAELDKCG